MDIRIVLVGSFLIIIIVLSVGIYQASQPSPLERKLRELHDLGVKTTPRSWSFESVKDHKEVSWSFFKASVVHQDSPTAYYDEENGIFWLEPGGLSPIQFIRI